MTDNLSDGIKVEFTLTPDTIVAYEHQQVDEDSWHEIPITLQAQVVNLIAERIAAKVSKDVSHVASYQQSIRDAITEAATNSVQRALEKTVQPTNTFGTPTGPAVTLEEMIDAKVTSWFTAKPDGYSRDTNLQKLISDAVDRQLKSHMNQAVEEAKKRVLAAVTAEGQKALNEALARIVQQGSSLNS